MTEGEGLHLNDNLLQRKKYETYVQYKSTCVTFTVPSFAILSKWILLTSRYWGQSIASLVAKMKDKFPKCQKHKKYYSYICS